LSDVAAAKRMEQRGEAAMKLRMTAMLTGSSFGARLSRKAIAEPK